MDVFAQLNQIVGEDNVSTDPDILQHYGLDWTRFYQPDPMAVVFPSEIAQVAALTRLANEAGLSLVPSGGRTGLSGGACATNSELVVSFEKMRAIKDFSRADSTVVVEAGVNTQSLQEYAADNELFYPVDFASSGSSQLGGNIATNAGGIRVIRYGMTRDWIKGLKVVTGKGEILELNKGLTKNNTGYDLRHAFIGSEGTLGFIVEATIQLLPSPKAASVMFLAVNQMQDCISVLETFRSRVTLNAFEVLSDNALDHVMMQARLPAPLPDRSAFYVLLEFEASDGAEEAVAEAFEHCLSEGWVNDAVMSASETQNKTLWQYRERISESITPRTPYKNDLSVTIGKIPAFLSAVDAIVKQNYPEFEIVWFGHIGDGNLHLNILRPEDWEVEQFKQACDVVSEKVLAVLREYGGSVSAEHGIGLLKKHQLHFSRSPEEIELMRSIKQAFDPNNVMNPGKLL